MFDELLYFYIFMYPKANMTRNLFIHHMVMFNLVPMPIKEFQKNVHQVDSVMDPHLMM